MTWTPSFCKACWFLKVIFFWIYKLFWKIWKISTWLSPQRCVSTFLGTFLHTCPELQAFIFLFFYPSLKSRPNFQLASRFADWGLLSQWELLPESCIEFHFSQLCCQSQFLGPDSQWCESTQGHQKSDCQRSLSFVFNEQLPYGFPFPLSSDVPASLLLLPYLIRAYDRKASHCLELLERQSTAASSSCLSICIFVAQQRCSVHHRHWAWLLFSAKTNYTLPSCASSSLIFPSISLVTRTRALSFLVFKCLHCSLHCRPQPKAQQLPQGQRGTEGRGWAREAARESRGLSQKVVLQCNFEKGRLWPTHRMTGCKRWHLKTLTFPTVGRVVVLLFQVTPLTRLTNNNN